MTLAACGGSGQSNKGPSAGNTNTAVLDLEIIDIDSSGNAIREDTSIGALIGITASTAPPQADVHYSLDESSQTTFTIDEASGVIRLRNGLDYEANKSYSIGVTASVGEYSATQIFKLDVIDYPQLDLVFPLPVGIYRGESIEIRGVLPESDPMSFDVFIENQSTELTTTPNESGYFSIPIPDLATFTKNQYIDINVVAMDNTGERGSKHISLYTGPVLTSPTAIAYDASRAGYWITDSSDGSIFFLDQSGSELRYLSSPNHGEGPNISSPHSIVVPPYSNKAYVSDSGGDAIFKVDLDSGDRQVLVQRDSGSNSDFITPNYLAYDSRLDFLYVNVDNNGSIERVDTDTGERLLIAKNLGGEGYWNSDENSLVVNENDGSVYSQTTHWLDPSSPKYEIKRINHNNSSIERVATASNGPTFYFYDMGLDMPRQRLLGMLPSYGIVEVDINTGDSGLFFNYEDLNETGFGGFAGMDIRQEENVVVLLNGFFSTIYSINLESKEWNLLYRRGIGDGSTFLSLKNLVFDKNTKSLYVSDFTLRGIRRVNILNGNRTIHNEEPGGGAGLLAFNPEQRLLYETMATDLTIHNLVSGSQESFETGCPAPTPVEGSNYLIDLKFSEARNTLYYLFYQHILAYDFSTNDCSVVASSDTGTGVEIGRAKDFWIDDSTDKIFVLDAVQAVDSDADKVVEVDLTNGERQEVFDLADMRRLGMRSMGSAIFYDSKRSYLYIGASGGGLSRIDLSAGDDAKAVKVEGYDSGVAFWGDVVGDIENDRVFVANSTPTYSVFAIDLATMSYQFISR